MKLKSLLLVGVLTMTLAAMCACSSNEPSEEPQSSGIASSASTQPQSSATTEPSAPEENATLVTILDCAAEGKIINSTFVLDSATVQDIETALGEANDATYVEAAKGTYYTYTTEGVVFGANKGDLVFELRSFSPELSSVTRADVIAMLGQPEYTSATVVAGEVVLGYTRNYTGSNSAISQIKIEFVFEGESDSAVINHYNIFDPAQTANYMNDDQGRQW